MATKNSSSMQIESLFRKAFERTKNRFFSYLFVYLIGIAIGLGAGVGLLLIGGAFFLIFMATKMAALLILLGIVLGVGLVGVLIYLGSWIQLTALSVVTADKKENVNAVLKKMRPLVPGYIVLNVLSGLFIFGLLPFGLVTLFIVLLVWAVWGSMAGFIYLYQKQPRGLQSLWLSKEMIRGNFWKVAGRLAIVLIVINLITSFLALSDNSFLSALTPLVSLVSGPFVIAYLYEIYKSLSVPKTAKVSTNWVALSVIGWVALLVIFVSVGAVLTTTLGQLMKNDKTFPAQYNRVNTLPVR